MACTSDQNKVEIIFGGDVLLSRNVAKEIEFRKESPFKHLQQRLNNVDLFSANLEGVMGSCGDSSYCIFHPPVFAISPENLKYLQLGNKNCFSLENNHSSDLGQWNKKRTMIALNQMGIGPITKEYSPQFFSIKGVTIGIVAVNLIKNRSGMVDTIPDLKIQQKIALAKTLANLCIVTIHWGSELSEWPNNQQRLMAKWIIAAGADVIIGSHPHVIQKPELVENKPVFFSLGNLLFDQKYEATKKGMLIKLSIDRNQVSFTGIYTHTSKNSFFPTIVDSIPYNFTIKTHSIIEINGVELKPKNIFDSTKYTVVLSGTKDNQVQWESQKIDLVSLFKADLKDGQNSLVMVEKHYSPIDKEVNLRPYVYQVTKNGLNAKWRGSALSWPLLDLKVCGRDNCIIHAVHRGDAFINLNPSNKTKRLYSYRWNGFGYRGLKDSISCSYCNFRIE